MTPKEKALDLYEKFIFPCWECDEFARAKECALIAINEILDELDEILNITGSSFIFEVIDYWMLVKQEIELL